MSSSLFLGWFSAKCEVSGIRITKQVQSFDKGWLALWIRDKLMLQLEKLGSCSYVEEE